MNSRSLFVGLFAQWRRRRRLICFFQGLAIWATAAGMPLSSVGTVRRRLRSSAFRPWHDDDKRQAQKRSHCARRAHVEHAVGELGQASEQHHHNAATGILATGRSGNGDARASGQRTEAKLAGSILIGRYYFTIFIVSRLS